MFASVMFALYYYIFLSEIMKRTFEGKIQTPFLADTRNENVW